ncbi:MAG TPA: DNA topoisomerase 4 subunit A [Flexilinea sp.]|nr:DNA topoisomerase 4 subunit A [Flexilinea sp.]HPR71762.1 DNA topoisomerase 4 subunit A [Flexilinea sp.]
MNNQGIKSVDIKNEMEQSYLDYAMSVIISRALPDARDGLKPVQRRILYAMVDMGIRPDSEFKKSARIVGEVLGKYHPHGDSAVYDAMARLAQDFTIRYPLVEGQGNFGSIDGDPPAAMRYTEARLAPYSMELLNDIDENTVDFTRNFDDTLDEPIVLPSALPNLLLNGSSGIAVGMATNIPPHNLGELVDAIVYLLDQWDEYDEITADDLMRYIHGPDFPTGGIIVLEDERNELVSAYATGRGKLMVRGRVHVEDMGRGRTRLIITEIPYQVNKNGLIERIALLTREGVLDTITDLRDESDRQGMRIVIELSKSADAEDVLRKLYKHTPLQVTFGIILLALVDNQPRILTLKQALRVYIDHRLDVIKRKITFELGKAEQRAHILEGLLIAIQHLDAIIKIIRNADDENDARTKIMDKYKLDREQTQAILDMPLKRLTHLEQDKLLKEFHDLEERIKEFQELLASPQKIRKVLIDNQLALKQKYADPRRTQIAVLGEGISSKEVLTANELVRAEPICIGMTAEGKIGRCDPEKINEKGFEIPPWILKTDTQQTVYVVSETGRAFGIYAETLPKVESFAGGFDANLISGWTADDKVAAVFTLSTKERGSETCSVITFSEKGMVKKSLAEELPPASSQSFTICKINPGDKLITVKVCRDDSKEILIATQNGMAIRFDQSDLRPMGLIAAGVNGIKLKEDDLVADATLVDKADFCCFVTSDWGIGKIPVEEFPKQGRYGQGVKAVRLNPSEKVVGITVLPDSMSVLLVRYGNNKARQVRQAMIKQVKRTKFLEYFIKLLNHKVTGINLLSAGEAENKSEKKSPLSSEKPKQPVKKEPKSKPVEQQKDEIPSEEEGNPEQFSLF